MRNKRPAYTDVFSGSFSTVELNDNVHDTMSIFWAECPYPKTFHKTSSSGGHSIVHYLKKTRLILGFITFLSGTNGNFKGGPILEAAVDINMDIKGAPILAAMSIKYGH